MNWWEADVEAGVGDQADAWWEQDTPAKPAPAKQTRRGLRQQSTLAERVSYAAGVNVLPESDLTWGERTDIGASDTTQERAAKFKGFSPEGEFRTITTGGGKHDIYRRSPDEPWRMRDTPGFDSKDLVDEPGELATLAAQAGVAAAFPPSLAFQLPAQAAAAGLTHLGKEGIEQARGYQQQPLGEVLGEAGIRTAGDLAVGAVPAGLAYALRGPKAQLSETIVNDFNAIQELRDLAGTDLPAPMAHQVRPDHLILGRLAAQASSTSPMMKSMMTEQQSKFADLVQQMGTDVPEQVGRTLTTSGKKAMTQQKKTLMRDFDLNNEQAGKAIKGIFDMDSPTGFYRKSRQEINAAYEDAGKLAEGVRFDMTGPQAAAREVTAPVEAQATDLIDSEILDLAGRPLGQVEVRNFVDVAASRGDKVNRVARLLDKIDPEQMNWEVVKELRSHVGDVIASNPAQEDVVSGAAKRIYGALSNTMENPIDASPAFVKAWKKANGLARKRFQVYEQGRVQRLLAEDSPSAAAKMFIDDPDQLTPVIREVVDQYAKDKRGTIKKSIQAGIIENPNSIDRINQWESVSKGNRQAYDWLFANPKEKKAFVQAAESMDDLRKAPIEQMLQSNTRMIDRGTDLLNRVGPGELNTTIKQLGGAESQAVQAMRTAAVDRILNKSLQITDDGLPTVDAKALTKAINEAKTQGIWEKLLTREDRIRLRGMNAYVRRVFKSLKDTGTSLEQAQAIAALKHPSTFIQGVHALAVNNRILAPMLTSKTAGRLFKPSTNTRRRGPSRSRKDAWFVFSAQFANEAAQLAAEVTAE